MGRFLPARIVDLSHPLDERLQVYPGDPVVRLSATATLDRDGFNLLNVAMGSQSGTHVDAPYHFFAGGARVDELELTMFLGPAVIADVRGKPPHGRITWEDLSPYADRLAPGRILVLHTGWSLYFGTARYFEHPCLEPEAAERILAMGVRTLALDCPSPDPIRSDRGASGGFPVHRLVLGAGCVIAENLTNLAAVDFADPVVSLLPLSLAGADGAPVRAVALQLR
jgi:kynurenine formamidase